MLVAGWWGGSEVNPTLGLRVRKGDRANWFDPAWSSVLIELPDNGEPVEVPITESFWEASSELRSREVGEYFKRAGLYPWPFNRPPHFDLQRVESRRFRLKPLV